jgi:hypothetical protein
MLINGRAVEPSSGGTDSHEVQPTPHRVDQWRRSPPRRAESFGCVERKFFGLSRPLLPDEHVPKAVDTDSRQQPTLSRRRSRERPISRSQGQVRFTDPVQRHGSRLVDQRLECLARATTLRIARMAGPLGRHDQARQQPPRFVVARLLVKTIRAPQLMAKPLELRTTAGRRAGIEHCAKGLVPEHRLTDGCGPLELRHVRSRLINGELADVHVQDLSQANEHRVTVDGPATALHLAQPALGSADQVGNDHLRQPAPPTLPGDTPSDLPASVQVAILSARHQRANMP